MRERSEEARWWAVRPASNLKPKSYLCPFCDQYLHALTEHVLVVPEGDLSRRRHAHSECVERARRERRLPSEAEWRAAQAPAGGRGRRGARRR